MIKSITRVPTGFPDMREDRLVGRAMVQQSLEGRRRRQGKGVETHPFLVKRWDTSKLGKMYRERDGRRGLGVGAGEDERFEA